MSVVPLLTAVTSPVDELTVATEVLLLLQDPPASPSLLYVSDAPMHSGDVPLTVPASASGSTVNVLKELLGKLHPPLKV